MPHALSFSSLHLLCFHHSVKSLSSRGSLGKRVSECSATMRYRVMVELADDMMREKAGI
jgi:hypothetical protein